MKKTILFLFLLFIILGHIGWYAMSRHFTTKPVPEEQTVTDFLYKLRKSAVPDLNSLPIESKFLTVGKDTIHMDILSHGMGFPSIVFIPGTSVYAQVYAEFLVAMHKSGFNVIGFDPRGHGRSSGLRGDYTINEIVDDTFSVINYTNKRFGGKISVIGSSQGGIAAFYAAARDKNSISAVVCHNFAVLNGKDNLSLSRLKLPHVISPAIQKVSSVYKDFALPVSLYLDLEQEKLKNDTSVAAYVNSDPLCVNWISVRAANSLIKTELAKPVEEISLPLMLIHSDKDTIFPQTYVEHIYDQLNCDKEYLLLKGRQHLVLINNVSEVVPEISGWLKKTLGY